MRKKSLFLLLSLCFICCFSVCFKNLNYKIYACDLDEEYVFDTEKFDESLKKAFISEANSFLKTADNAMNARIEYCNPNDYRMSYYKLTDEELKNIKDMLKNAYVNIEKPSYLADFRTALHMFDTNEEYVYVISLNSDNKTMYCQYGELICDGLADYLASFINKTEIESWENIYDK